MPISPKVVVILFNSLPHIAQPVRWNHKIQLWFVHLQLPGKHTVSLHATASPYLFHSNAGVR